MNCLSLKVEQADLVEVLPIGDDPFSDDYQLTELPAGDDPFAKLPEIVAVAVDAPIIATAVVPGFYEGRTGPSDGCPNGGSRPQPIPTESTEEPVVTQADLVRRRFFLTALPSWAISLGVHVAVLFLASRAFYESDT